MRYQHHMGFHQNYGPLSNNQYTQQFGNFSNISNNNRKTFQAPATGNNSMNIINPGQPFLNGRSSSNSFNQHQLLGTVTSKENVKHDDSIVRQHICMDSDKFSQNVTVGLDNHASHSKDKSDTCSFRQYSNQSYHSVNGSSSDNNTCTMQSSSDTSTSVITSKENVNNNDATGSQKAHIDSAKPNQKTTVGTDNPAYDLIDKNDRFRQHSSDGYESISKPCADYNDSSLTNSIDLNDVSMHSWLHSSIDSSYFSMQSSNESSLNYSSHTAAFGNDSFVQASSVLVDTSSQSNIGDKDIFTQNACDNSENYLQTSSDGHDDVSNKNLNSRVISSQPDKPEQNSRQDSCPISENPEKFTINSKNRSSHHSTDDSEKHTDSSSGVDVSCRQHQHDDKGSLSDGHSEVCSAGNDSSSQLLNVVNDTSASNPDDNKDSLGSLLKNASSQHQSSDSPNTRQRSVDNCDTSCQNPSKDNDCIKQSDYNQHCNNTDNNFDNNNNNGNTASGPLMKGVARPQINSAEFLFSIEEERQMGRSSVNRRLLVPNSASENETKLHTGNSQNVYQFTAVGIESNDSNSLKAVISTQLKWMDKGRRSEKGKPVFKFRATPQEKTVDADSKGKQTESSWSGVFPEITSNVFSDVTCQDAFLKFKASLDDHTKESGQENRRIQTNLREEIKSLATGKVSQQLEKSGYFQRSGVSAPEVENCVDKNLSETKTRIVRKAVKPSEKSKSECKFENFVSDPYARALFTQLETLRSTRIVKTAVKPSEKYKNSDKLEETASTHKTSASFSRLDEIIYNLKSQSKKKEKVKEKLLRETLDVSKAAGSLKSSNDFRIVPAKGKEHTTEESQAAKEQIVDTAQGQLSDGVKSSTESRGTLLASETTDENTKTGTKSSRARRRSKSRAKSVSISETSIEQLVSEGKAVKWQPGKSEQLLSEITNGTVKEKVRFEGSAFKNDVVTAQSLVKPEKLVSEGGSTTVQSGKNKKSVCESEAAIGESKIETKRSQIKITARQSDDPLIKKKDKSFSEINTTIKQSDSEVKSREKYNRESSSSDAVTTYDSKQATGSSSKTRVKCDDNDKSTSDKQNSCSIDKLCHAGESGVRRKENSFSENEVKEKEERDEWTRCPESGLQQHKESERREEPKKTLSDLPCVIANGTVTVGGRCESQAADNSQDDGEGVAQWQKVEKRRKVTPQSQEQQRTNWEANKRTREFKGKRVKPIVRVTGSQHERRVPTVQKGDRHVPTVQRGDRCILRDQREDRHAPTVRRGDRCISIDQREDRYVLPDQKGDRSSTYFADQQDYSTDDTRCRPRNREEPLNWRDGKENRYFGIKTKEYRRRPVYDEEPLNWRDGKENRYFGTSEEPRRRSSYSKEPWDWCDGKDTSTQTSKDQNIERKSSKRSAESQNWRSNDWSKYMEPSRPNGKQNTWAGARAYQGVQNQEVEKKGSKRSAEIMDYSTKTRNTVTQELYSSVTQNTPLSVGVRCARKAAKDWEVERKGSKCNVDSQDHAKREEPNSGDTRSDHHDVKQSSSITTRVQHGRHAQTVHRAQGRQVNTVHEAEARQAETVQGAEGRQAWTVQRAEGRQTETVHRAEGRQAQTVKGVEGIQSETGHKAEGRQVQTVQGAEGRQSETGQRAEGRQGQTVQGAEERGSKLLSDTPDIQGDSAAQGQGYREAEGACSYLKESSYNALKAEDSELYGKGSDISAHYCENVGGFGANPSLGASSIYKKLKQLIQDAYPWLSSDDAARVLSAVRSDHGTLAGMTWSQIVFAGKNHAVWTWRTNMSNAAQLASSSSSSSPPSTISLPPPSPPRHQEPLFRPTAQPQGSSVPSQDKENPAEKIRLPRGAKSKKHIRQQAPRGSAPVKLAQPKLQVVTQKPLKEKVVSPLKEVITFGDKAHDDECVICQELLELFPVRRLDCGHVYHKACITAWTLRDRTCPMCRSLVLFEEDFPSLKRRK